jgi:hypothetical protein
MTTPTPSKEGKTDGIGGYEARPQCIENCLPDVGSANLG